jgi:hypothetical protein
MNPKSFLTLQAIRTLVTLMLETLERDRDTERYDDLFTRLLVDVETLTAHERRPIEGLPVDLDGVRAS